MKRQADVSIVLTSSQLAQVHRDTSSEEQGLGSLLATFENLGSASELLDAAYTANVSRSVLRALLVLAAFPLDGAYRALADVAREIGNNPSTTHRYVSTWLAIGLLEQDPKTRKYRRPVSPSDSSRTQRPATRRPNSRRRGNPHA